MAGEEADGVGAGRALARGADARDRNDADHSESGEGEIDGAHG